MSKPRYHAAGFIFFDDDRAHHILVKIYIRCVLQHFTPGGRKQHSVVLCAWAPHGGALAAVQHPELDGTQVANNTAIATHCIYLSNNLTFGNATHCRVAAHLGNSLHVHGYQQNLAAQVGRCGCCFATGMTGTYYNHIIFWEHAAKILYGFGPEPNFLNISLSSNSSATVVPWLRRLNSV